MNGTVSLEETARYVRLVLPLMTKHGVPITPNSGKNKELREAIDTIIEKKEPCSEETNEKLYQRFAVEKEESMLNEIREKLQQTLLTVFGELGELNEQTQAYESTALKSVGKLSESMSVQDIRSILDEVIVATKKLRRSGEVAQQRLNETTKTLQVLQQEFQQTKNELLVDFLTGVLNRKGFDESLAKFISEATDNLCLLIIDIDHFKKFNDKYGHIVGDDVLQIVAKNIGKDVRGNDLIARVGGEEFAVILPKTPLLGAVTVAENVRASIARLKLERKSETLETITVSIGAAQYQPGESLKDFVNRADDALYFSKNEGSFL